MNLKSMYLKIIIIKETGNSEWEIWASSLRLSLKNSVVKMNIILAQSKT